jgi:hypothetical protein
MKICQTLLLGLGLLGSFFAAPAKADVVYTGVRTAGTATANLSIRTDGTIGVLSTGNVLDWVISMTDGVDSFTLLGPMSGPNSTLLIQGVAFSATATDLLFDFSAAGSNFALFQAPSVGSGQTFYCVQTNGCFDSSGAGEGIDPRLDFEYQRAALSGSVSIASAESLATPEPSTAVLLGAGAIGFFLFRRRRASVTN